MRRVPFVDLSLMHQDMTKELTDVFQRVLRDSTFVLGPEVEGFERSFASYCQVDHCVAVNTGTAALHLVLAALGVGYGDEVITVAHTFIATAEAITAVGATPVFIDIDPTSYCMDASKLEAAITPKTRAIIPVHLYGQTADMDAVREIADHHSIPVIEDACQAHGAEYKGERAGSLALAGCFSFYPGKNLGACGEGGAITTNDPELARRLRMWRDHGSSKKYVHTFSGLNMRMEGIQGGVLALKLRYLDQWNNQRREVAGWYRDSLTDTSVILPCEMSYGKHVYHLFVVQAEDRDALRQQLSEAGVESGLHYPIPLHLQEAYKHLGYRTGALPVTEYVKDHILSLPMYPGMTRENTELVAAQLQEICNVA